MGDMSKRVLWTSRGRFQFHGSEEEEELNDFAGLSDVALFCGPRDIMDDDDFNNILMLYLHVEAREVASGVPELDTKIVLECILYTAMIIEDNCINWSTHAANYWVCDGIIHDTNGCGRLAWEIGDALHKNMNLDWHSDKVRLMRGVLHKEQWAHRNRWVSATGQNTAALQAATTSFFWKRAIIEGGTFKDLDKSRLRVLHLSHCTFSFSSPPFLSCSYLRFLLLDHCKDENDAPDRREEQGHNQVTDVACFQKLWVLVLSYTEWYWLLSEKILDLMTELRELNVKGLGNWSISHLHSRCSGAGSNRRRPCLKLRVVRGPKDNDNIGYSSGRRKQKASLSFPDLSNWNNLKTLILDGCDELEEIGCNTLPPSLDSFSFTTEFTTTGIHSMSFRGCVTLKSLLLRGSFSSLVELDMSGTLIKTLDLSETQAVHLKRLFLLGCEKLRAILWPQKKELDGEIYSFQPKKYEGIKLEVLHIDTTCAAWAIEGKSNKQEATSDSTSAESSSTVVHGNGQTPTNLALYISLRDPRLFRALMHMELVNNLHIEITSTGNQKGASRVNNTSSSGSEQGVRAFNLQNAAGKNLYISTFEDIIDAPVTKWMWPCPPIPTPSDWAHCYISIQDETPSQSLRDTAGTRQQTSTALPGFVHKNAVILHLHDSLSITCIPGPAPATALVALDWDKLRWCQLKRCPNLEGSVFSTPSIRDTQDAIFCYLETFWASQLLKARYIWDWSGSLFYPLQGSFGSLVFLHLDYCPRLVHVLPLYPSNGNGCRSLETLEIVCCGELREIFPLKLESKHQKEHWEFPSLKRIHLYELPMLQRICGRMMFAPRLEIVKIRGCWSLKRLPAICRAPPNRSTLAQAESLNNSESEEVEESSESDKEEAHMAPTMDCEKEWWDSLEWDGEEAGHHPSRYKLTHSAYYRKTLLRATVLR
ncbi:unnamed protein product [Urochloa humidicola]